MEYLERWGNPCQWINLCPTKCLPLISSALETHKQIAELSQKLGEIKEQVIDEIQRPDRYKRKGQYSGRIENELKEFITQKSKFDETEEMRKKL